MNPLADDWSAVLDQPGTVWLDTIRGEPGEAASLLFTNPHRLITAHDLADVPNALAALDDAVATGYHVAGFMSYEASAAWLPGLVASDLPATPLVWFGVYDAPRRLTPEEVAAAMSNPAPAPLSQANFGWTPDAYTARIDAIKNLIREGEVYQINFTGPITFDLGGAPRDLFATLRQTQRVAYGAWIRTKDTTVVSLSPELFWGRDDDRIYTRPMKGTVRRGRTLEEDTVLREWLGRDEKSRAENLMIVDLLRNDLSMCCEPGSVQVPALFTVEAYETLFQMTSTVEGRLVPDIQYADLFKALFPCGSVTGAPKLRAMQHIAKLEAQPRGVYCGTIGYITPAARARFSVAIRTAVLREQTDGSWHGTMGTGSGIVWDSDATAEYEECRLKAQFLTAPPPAQESFRLIETMCWQDGIRLLDRHIQRLADSAVYFGFPFDPTALRHRIHVATATLTEGTRHKVRVTLGADGVPSLTVSPLPPASTAPLRLTIARERIDSHDVFFYHKTTRRTTYETAYDAAQAAGFDEAILLNERGECCEGTRSNLFIKRKDGTFMTPPVAAGLLRGVYRQHLLASLPRVEERTLYPRDLLTAEALYVCNAVWGVRRGLLTPSTAFAEAETTQSAPLA